MSNLVLPHFPVEQKLSSWANIAIVAQGEDKLTMQSRICRYFEQKENAKIWNESQTIFEWEQCFKKAVEKDSVKAEERASILVCPPSVAALQLISASVHYKAALESSLGTISVVDQVGLLHKGIWKDFPNPYDIIFFKTCKASARLLWYYFLRPLLSVELCEQLIKENMSDKQSWLVLEVVDVNRVNLYRFNDAGLDIKSEEPTLKDETSWLSSLRFW